MILQRSQTACRFFTALLPLTLHELVNLDHSYRFRQSRVAEDVALAPLNTHGSRKRFIMTGEIIYGTCNENRLWTYDLEDQTFAQLNGLPQSIGYLTDIYNDTLLVSHIITAKKDIVELQFDD